MTITRRQIAPFAAVLLLVASAALPAAGNPQQWKSEWPRTNFSRATVDLADITSGGLPKDGIPSIDDPRFVPVGEVSGLVPKEPILSLVIGEDARAYPLRVMIWHEIVNDVVAGVPVVVTYCPLCNAGIVFDRRLDGRMLDFGTSGKLRHSDLVMYDRQTESWWQQYGGNAVVGDLAGRSLEMLPSRLESLASFRMRAPKGRVLVPSNPRFRRYGTNPYVGYDQAPRPVLFTGDVPDKVPAMMRVVAVGKEAWSLPLVREKESIVAGDLRISWRPGQVSALDTSDIARGADVGNVVVQRRGNDVPHAVTFAFAFFAFEPDGVLYTETGPIRRQVPGEDR